MGIFKKRKVEVIDIKFDKEEEKELIQETVLKNKYLLDSSTSIDSQKSVILNDFAKLEQKQYDILNGYYICKIFSRVALKDRDYNEQVLNLDKHVNKMRRDLDEINYLITKTKQDEADEEILQKTYNKLNESFDFARGLLDTVDTIKRSYYNHLKLTTVSTCMNKNNTELEQLQRNINNLIGDYRSIGQASQFVYYNSGEFICKLIKSLVKCIEDTDNKEYIYSYNYHYFLATDDIIVLEKNEWIDLYNKMKFVMKIINDVSIIDFLNFKDLYLEFEARYTIIMLDGEITKNRTNFRL